jgi:hypothetical protein
MSASGDGGAACNCRPTYARRHGLGHPRRVHGCLGRCPSSTASRRRQPSGGPRRLAMTDVLRVHGSNIDANRSSDACGSRPRSSPSSDAFFRTVDVAAPDAETPGADTVGSAPDASGSTPGRSCRARQHRPAAACGRAGLCALAVRTTATAGLVAYLVLALARRRRLGRLGTAWAYFLAARSPACSCGCGRRGRRRRWRLRPGTPACQTPLLSGWRLIRSSSASISGATLGDILVGDPADAGRRGWATDAFVVEDRCPAATTGPRCRRRMVPQRQRRRRNARR